ncbi:hypothetical protein O7600_21390 [Micromonospora sp. WMMA1998]|uniref:hypothetical protein n=1 Tax=Micromonospora sp. WMMA1998 TaxID=3015167 RepID=UPI00248CBE57|nr:hypothetical protein [Micromonospora sp. WMMA1998]WBC13668.1 hypothetical protein O7600_21390 [Micromonospora sp. WMMA1998]
MRSRAATTAATVVTLLSGLLTLLGCLSCLPFLAPTEPCPNDTADSFQQARIVLFLLSVVMLLAAALSVALAWGGRWSHFPNPWPWLAVSVLTMVLSASMTIPIDRLSSC